MVRSRLPVGVALTLGAWTVLADQPSCSLTQKCPQDSPCCSQYGQCGVGAYCLGGCDPRMSFSLDACVPEPVCRDKVYAMNSMDGIVDISKYLGDPSTADWVSQGEPVVYNGNVLLTMPPHSVGTVMATTDYMWYGNVKASLKSSRGAGVVTAFILLSDVKDEIDYEFVGSELGAAQTNYYFQGIPDYDNSGNITLSDTYQNFHSYEIQWTPDTITWLVDGKVGRVKKRADTWNATSNQWDYPQTPSRVQISIWPGGAASNAPGTITWAGGPIDWDSPDIKAYGYDFATFGTVEVQCSKATAGPGTNGGVSYTYENAAAVNSSVVNGDKPTVLKSFLGTGLDMDAGAPNASSSSGTGTGTASASAGAPVASVPGGTANGPGLIPGDGSGGGNAAGASGSDAGSGQGGSTGTGTASASACTETGFTQNCGGTSGAGATRSDGIKAGGQSGLGTSTFGVVVGLAALLLH